MARYIVVTNIWGKKEVTMWLSRDVFSEEREYFDTLEEAEDFVDSLEDDRRLVRLAGIDHFVPSPIGRFRSLIKRLSFYL